MSGYGALTAVIGLAASIGCASSRPAEKAGEGSAPSVDSADTRASLETLLADLARAYAPPAGLSVARHVPPFPAARQEILTLSRGPAAERRPAVIWRLRDGTLEPASTTYGPSPETEYLESVLAVMANVDLQDIEGAARMAAVTGDFVFVAGTPADRIVADLQTVLRSATPPLNVTLRMTELNRDVSVARGRFTHTPLAGRERNELEIFGSSRPATPDSDSSGELGAFLREVGHFTGRRVIDSTDSRTVPVSWRYQAASVRTGDSAEVARVLQNVGLQTGLSFAPENRKVRVVEVR